MSETARSEMVTCTGHSLGQWCWASHEHNQVIYIVRIGNCDQTFIALHELKVGLSLESGGVFSASFHK